MTSRGCCMTEAAPSGLGKSWAVSSIVTLGSGHWATAHANATKYKPVGSRAEGILMEAGRRSQNQKGQRRRGACCHRGYWTRKGDTEKRVTNSGDV